MVVKKLNHLELGQKIYASRGLCVVHAYQFCGRGLSGFGDISILKFDQFSLSDHGL